MQAGGVEVGGGKNMAYVSPEKLPILRDEREISGPEVIHTS